LGHFKYSYKGFDFEGFSEGGIKTSIILSRLDLMFDIGALDADKCHVKNVLLSHGHLDHSALLPYYISQRSLRKLPAPNIYLHEQLYEPMKKILDVYSDIEGFDYSYNLSSVRPGDKMELNKNMFFKSMPTFHRVPSQGYTVFETSVKLKTEYLALGKEEIIRKKEANEDIFITVDTPIISFSGDTKIEYVLENSEVRKSRILFLECTYVDEQRDVQRAREWGHIHLDEIVAHADEFENEQIILIHFSRRYSKQFVAQTLKKKLPQHLYDRVTFVY